MDVLPKVRGTGLEQPGVHGVLALPRKLVKLDAPIGQTVFFVRIIAAHSTEHLPVVRQLFQEYADATGIDLCFQNFTAELANLPGKYAPSEGRLFLAQVDGNVAGCVALRKIANGICEMKRLYVRPHFRKKGAGLLLANATIDAAREIGYQSMRLDTLSSMTAAIALYDSLGFRPIPPYYHNPNPDTVFLELKLR